MKTLIKAFLQKLLPSDAFESVAEKKRAFMEKFRALHVYLGSIFFRDNLKRIKGIRIETCSACNLRCVYCPTGTQYAHGGVAKKNISQALIEKIISEIKDMKKIAYAVLYLGGEPLLNKNLVKIAGDLLAGTHIRAIEIVTNGMLLSNAFCRELSLLTSGRIYIQVSIDGRSPEENDRYRQGSDYELIKGNVLRARKILPHNVLMAIANVYVPTRQESASRPKTPEFLLRDFAELLTGKYGPFQIKTIYSQVWPDLTDDAIVSQNLSKVKSKTSRFCLFPFEEIVIRSNGDLIPCCYDLTSQMNLGNINERTLAESVNSAGYIKLRKALRINAFGKKAVLPPLCEKCVFISGDILVKN